MSAPGPIAQITGRIAYEFTQVQHLIPTYLHIILAALFPIYTAAHASLSRPSSAAKPKRNKPKGPDEDDDEDDEDKPRMEGLSPTDAILFPLTAGLALTALYFLIKWDKALLNKLLNWYMSLAGLYGVVKFLSDTKHIVHTFVFPSYYTMGSVTWTVDQTTRKVHAIGEGRVDKASRNSPLPWIFSKLPLPQAFKSFLWNLRDLPSRKMTFKLYAHRLVAVRTHFNVFHLMSLFEGVALVMFFTFIDKPWYLTNLMGFAFSYTALQLISPTTFATGSLVLAGLFFYDIYMVFFTPMMVTVAKNLDIPIKLLFPRPTGVEESAKRQYSMLGLGDIVLPGIVMGLALRFDLYLFYLKKQRKVVSLSVESGSVIDDKDGKRGTEVIKSPYVSPSKNWANHIWSTSLIGHSEVPANKHFDAGQFPKTYFNASLGGYIAGMITTLSAMHWSAHPQPALLYLVPGVLGAIWATAAVRGELREMWHFTEEEEEVVCDDKGQIEERPGGKMLSSAVKSSIFSSAHDSRREEAFRRVARRVVETGDSDEELTAGNRVEEDIETKKGKISGPSFRRDRKNDLIFFSLSSYSPLKHNSRTASKDSNWVPVNETS